MLVGALAVLVGLTLFSVVRERPPLSTKQKLDAVTGVEPYGIGRRVRFVRWADPSSAAPVHTALAHYDGPGVEGGFSITFLAREHVAGQRFESERAAMGRMTAVQEINTFPAEYCAGHERTIDCVGYVGGARNVFLRSWSRGVNVDDFDDGLDTLLLIRTARKHLPRAIRGF